MNLENINKFTDIYLIANNSLLSDKHLKNIKNSICIHFNTAIHINKIDNSNDNQLILNNHTSSGGGIFGLKQLEKNMNRYTKFFLNIFQIQQNMENFKIIINNFQDKNYNFEIFDAKSIDDPYFQNHLVSIGAVSTYLICKKYGEIKNINLIGFTGEYKIENFQYSWGNGHNWKGEKELIQNLVDSGLIKNLLYNNVQELILSQKNQ